MSRYYHLCFVVQDIEAATREMTETLGVAWSPVRDGRLGDWDYRIVFSVDGPPFLELVEGSPGSPWDASSGPRFDHLGFWAEEIDAEKQALAARGAPLDFDATPLGRPFTYHRLKNLGARVELVDRAVQAVFIERWAPHLSSMPSLRVDGVASGNGPTPAPGTSSAGVATCRATLIEFLAAIDHGHATKALDLFTHQKGQRGRSPIRNTATIAVVAGSRPTITAACVAVVWRSASADSRPNPIPHPPGDGDQPGEVGALGERMADREQAHGGDQRRDDRAAGPNQRGVKASQGQDRGRKREREGPPSAAQASGGSVIRRGTNLHIYRPRPGFSLPVYRSTRI